jgi:DNA-binding IclR family transcriptional regulator
VNSKPIEVISRTSALLRYLAGAEPQGATTSEVARGAVIARPTAHRMLTTLHSEGFVHRNRKGRWSLGPELYLLGAVASARFDVTSIAQPLVRELARETGESAFFSIRRGSETVCLLREEGSFPVRSHVLFEGLRLPLGVASAGLAILAFLPQVEVAQFLQTHDLSSAFGESHSRAAVQRRLASTRRLGYAVNPGLLVAGSWGVGAPLLDRTGAPVGALSLNGIEQRFGRERLAVLGQALVEASTVLARTIHAARPLGSTFDGRRA